MEFLVSTHLLVNYPLTRKLGLAQGNKELP